MTMIELSPPLRETLKRLGELEVDALKIVIRARYFLAKLRIISDSNHANGVLDVSCPWNIAEPNSAKV